MAMFSAGVKNEKGPHMEYPQERGFTPSFWGKGWGSQEEKQSHGKAEKDSGKMKGSKHGACPFCG